MIAFDRWVETARKSSRGERTDMVLIARQTFNELKSDRNCLWLKRYIERKMHTVEIHEVPAQHNHAAVSGSGPDSLGSLVGGGNSSGAPLGTLDEKTVFYLFMLCDPLDVPSRIMHIVQLLGNERGNIPLETVGLLLLASVAAKCVSLGDFTCAFEAPLRRVLISILERRQWLPAVDAQATTTTSSSTAKATVDSGLKKSRNNSGNALPDVPMVLSTNNSSAHLSIIRTTTPQLRTAGSSRSSYNSSNPTTVRGGGGGMPMSQESTSGPSSSRTPLASPVANGGGSGMTSGTFHHNFTRDSSWSGYGGSFNVPGNTYQKPVVSTLPQSKSWVVEQLGLQRTAMLTHHEDQFSAFGGFPQLHLGTSVENPPLTVANTSLCAPPLGTLGQSGSDTFTPDDIALGAPSRVTIPDIAPLDPQRTAGPVALGSDCESTGTTEVAALPSGFRVTASYSAPAGTMRDALRIFVALMFKLPEAAAEKLLELAADHVPEFPPDTEEEMDSIVTVALSFTLVTVIANHIDVNSGQWEPPTSVRGGPVVGAGANMFILSASDSSNNLLALSAARQSRSGSNGSGTTTTSTTGANSSPMKRAETLHGFDSMQRRSAPLPIPGMFAARGDHGVMIGEATKQDLTKSSGLGQHQQQQLDTNRASSPDGLLNTDDEGDISSLGNASCQGGANPGAFVMTSHSVKRMFGLVGAAGSNGGGGPGNGSTDQLPESARSGLLPTQQPGIPPKLLSSPDSPQNSPTQGTSSNFKAPPGRRNTTPSSNLSTGERGDTAAVAPLGGDLDRSRQSSLSTSLLIPSASGDRARRSSVVVIPPSGSPEGAENSGRDSNHTEPHTEEDRTGLEGYAGISEQSPQPAPALAMDFGGAGAGAGAGGDADYSDHEEPDHLDATRTPEKTKDRYHPAPTDGGGPMYDEDDGDGVTPGGEGEGSQVPTVVNNRTRKTTAQGTAGGGCGCCAVM